MADCALSHAARAAQQAFDCRAAAGNRRHYARLLHLARLGRERRPASRVTARERADLDMLWRQYRHYTRLERQLGGGAPVA